MDQAEPSSIAVTGADGYIGGSLCRLLASRGVPVRALSRRPPAVHGLTHVAYDLRQPVLPAALTGASAVVHLAAETKRTADPDTDMELDALRRLLAEAARVGARFVFVSSQTARPDAPTAYGLLKWQGEQLTLAQGGVVARPGQVYGGAERALWGRLARLARTAAVLPRFVPDPVVQPIHVDDLATALARLAQDHTLPARVYAVADPQPVALSRFLSDTAWFRYGRTPLLVPLPAAAVRLVAERLGAIGLAPAAFRQLNSLLRLPILDSAADLAALETPVRAFRLGVTRAGLRRTALLREGRVLLQYLLGASPDRASLKGYVRTIESMHDPMPLDLPPFVRRMPWLVSLFDLPAARAQAGADDLLTRRLDLALMLAEGGTAQADRFLLAPDRARRIRHSLEALTALAADTLFRGFGALLQHRLAQHRPRADPR
jgi:NADH dehydrogenase